MRWTLKSTNEKKNNLHTYSLTLGICLPTYTDIFIHNILYIVIRSYWSFIFFFFFENTWFNDFIQLANVSVSFTDAFEMFFFVHFNGINLRSIFLLRRNDKFHITSICLEKKFVENKNVFNLKCIVYQSVEWH